MKKFIVLFLAITTTALSFAQTSKKDEYREVFGLKAKHLESIYGSGDQISKDSEGKVSFEIKIAGETKSFEKAVTLIKHVYEYSYTDGALYEETHGLTFYRIGGVWHLSPGGNGELKLLLKEAVAIIG